MNTQEMVQEIEALTEERDLAEAKAKFLEDAIKQFIADAEKFDESYHPMTDDGHSTLERGPFMCGMKPMVISAVDLAVLKTKIGQV